MRADGLRMARTRLHRSPEKGLQRKLQRPDLADRGFGSVTLADDASGTNGKRRSGSFDSGVVDAQAMVDWDRVMLRADVPSGCTLTVRVRTGSTAVPDGSWSSWRTVADGDRVGKGSRYIQYRVELTSQAKTGTPSLYGIGFVNNGTPLATATETR